MTPEMAAAFADELEKRGAPAILSRLSRLRSLIPGSGKELAGRVWRSLPARAAAGGAGGAALGAATAEEGQGLTGAIRGGLLGAGGAAAAPLLTRAGRQRAKGSLVRFGQAQKHALTGKGKLPVSPSVKGKDLERIRAAEAAGLTSIPGAVRGLVTKPGKTLKKAWQTESGLGKAMAAGDVALSAPRILDPTTEAGVGEKALGTLGSAGGYLVGSRMPLVGNLLFASGTGALGKYLGRGVDVITGSGRKGGKKLRVGHGATTKAALRAVPQVGQVAKAIHPQVGQLVQ